MEISTSTVQDKVVLDSDLEEISAKLERMDISSGVVDVVSKARDKEDDIRYIEPDQPHSWSPRQHLRFDHVSLRTLQRKF